MQPSVHEAVDPDVICFNLAWDEYRCLHFVPAGKNTQRFEQLERVMASKEIDLSSVEPSSPDWRLLAYMALFRLTANPNIEILSFKPNHSATETRRFVGQLLGAAGILLLNTLTIYFNKLLDLLGKQSDPAEFSNFQASILSFANSFGDIFSEYLELENFERPTRGPGNQTEGDEINTEESLETIFKNALQKLSRGERELKSLEQLLVEKSKIAGLTIQELQAIQAQLRNVSVFVRALQDIFMKGNLVQNSKDPMVRLALDSYLIYIFEVLVRSDRGVVQSREEVNQKSLLLTSYLLSLESQLNRKHAEDLITQILRSKVSGLPLMQKLKEAIKIGEALHKAPITYMLENPLHSKLLSPTRDHAGILTESNDHIGHSQIDIADGISGYEAYLEFNAVVLNELRNSILNTETPEEYIWLLIKLGLTSSIYLYSYPDILRFRPELVSA
ncbi:MAG: hypothetical protein QXL01_07140, partial [Thermoplasmatales archaeon]